MAETRRSGRANKLTGQVGEYLVAAELARRDLIATTFTGNVPHFDIVASDSEGHHVSVQVKTSKSDSWQFTMDRYCRIRFKGERQVVEAALPCPVRGLVVVLVRLGSDGATDRFFVVSWVGLRDILIRAHKDWLRKHGGIRPKNPHSLHAAIGVSALEGFENQWGTVGNSLL